MTSSEIWNIINIVILIAAASFNFLYFRRHTNGKKYIRLLSGVMLSIALFFRLLLMINVVGDLEFTKLIRPWAGLIYLLPALDAYVDWQAKRKEV